MPLSLSLSLSQLLPHEFQAVEIEALAAIRASEFALEHCIAQVVLEGDSKVILDALAEEDVSLSSHSLLIANAKSLSPDFFQLRYSHVKKEGNKITHNLTRHAITVSEFIVWIKSVPPQVAFVYQTDLFCFNKYCFLFPKKKKRTRRTMQKKWSKKQRGMSSCTFLSLVFGIIDHKIVRSLILMSQ